MDRTTEQEEKVRALLSQTEINRFIGGHKMYAFISFILFLVTLFVVFIIGDALITDTSAIMFIAVLSLFIHGVLQDGNVERQRREKKTTGINNGSERVKLPDNHKRSGMFGWVSALNCDNLTSEDTKAQCEFDGSTLYQQLGDFDRWVNTDKSGRRIYGKDFKRLREDKCNLFGREDLQTQCKLNKIKY